MYVVVTSSHNAETGLPWCGDCRASEPLLRKTVRIHLSSLMQLYYQCDCDGYNHPFFICIVYSRCHPYISVYPSQLASIGGYLVEAQVDRESFKGVAEHPYRTHAQLQVQRIPTLYKYDPATNTVVDTLIEGDVYDKEKIAAFLGVGVDQIIA